MKTYRGRRLGSAEDLSGIEVTVNNRPLRHQVRHNPTGFEWGYGGSGPADLALSILWNFLGKEPSRILYMDFKSRFVARWKDKWEITSLEIQSWIDSGDYANCLYGRFVG